MSQKTKTKIKSDDIEQENGDLLTRFKDEQSRKVDRVVTLKYKSCCGCGCTYSDITRIVPFDSPLKDGDKVSNLEKGDKPV